MDMVFKPHYHYSDVIWVSWYLKSLATPLFGQQFVHTDNKESIKVPHYWPIVRGIHIWPLPMTSNVKAPQYPIQLKTHKISFAH